VEFVSLTLIVIIEQIARGDWLFRGFLASGLSSTACMEIEH
jgi:hypothetical protein